MYRFTIKRKDGRIKVVERSSLAEALRSRHAYRKSPHFRDSYISLVVGDHDVLPIPTLGDMLIFKKRR